MTTIEQKLSTARTLLEQGDSDQARMLLLEVLKEDGKQPTALLMLGGVYFHEKKFAEAQLVYERLIKVEPGSGMLSIALFNSLWKQGKHEEAAAEIHRFISVADKNQELETIKQYAAISKAIAEGAYQVE